MTERFRETRDLLTIAKDYLDQTGTPAWNNSYTQVAAAVDAARSLRRMADSLEQICEHYKRPPWWRRLIRFRKRALIARIRGRKEK